MQRYYFLLENMYRAMIIFWLTCLEGYPRTSAPEPGSLVISGTKGYAYVPAPWWKTDYFELRYEDQNENKKFFYKWDGFGLRYEIQEFISCIVNKRFSSARLRRKESICMARVMQLFKEQNNLFKLQ